MAASKLIHTQMLYFCYHNGHVGSETISTDIFKLKCTAHIPVYLFANARDDVFLTRHYYDVDENHPGFTVFQCTRCEEKFDKTSKSDDIRDHICRCSIRVPKFVRTCRFCGLGITRKMIEDKYKENVKK